MPFLIDGNPTNSEISEAVNYLLSNFTVGSAINPDSGQIIGPGGVVIGYLYKYMAVKYADSYDGAVGFSNSPTNKQYYGLRNSDSATESTNPTDYVWYEAAGGFGTLNFLWYVTTGGRQIQFAVSPTAPDSGWLVDPGTAIDLDLVTSSTTPIIAQSFFSYFTPSILQVPRSGNPLVPSFTGIAPTLYSTDGGIVVPFVDAQTDSAVNFVNGTWRIGNSSTTGYGDISYTNITIGSPTDGGDFAVWPNPTAMSSSPAYISVPVRYKDSTGTVTQASVATLQLLFIDPGPAGQNSPYIDISGYTGFVVNAGGAFTPSTATLSAITTAVTSPSYSWAITGATPTSSTNSSVVITPDSSATSVSVTLTVNGTNLLSPLSKTVTMPVTYDGATGQAGANGVMSAFPSIYIWTGSAATPTRPSTTSTYTWADGSYSAPSGWSTTAPSNTTAGNYLWSITIPLNVSATTVSSTLDWTNTAYPIRCIAYNGTNGTNGSSGATGASGSATFLVTRSANDSSPPTNAEVNAVIGRNPVAGDIVTVSYNNANNAVVYRYTTSWITQATYITGSLIVSNTITADKLSVNSLSAISANLGNVTAGDIKLGTNPEISGTTMTGTGAHIYNDGRMVLGNSTNNITWNGSTLTISGDIVGYGNLNGTAIGQIIAGSFNFVTKTTTGTGTFVVPTDVYKIKVTCIGGGGGGGLRTTSNPGCGGGGGGACIKVITVTPGQVYSYNVGAGGAVGPANSGKGSDGGNTTFSGYTTALAAYGGTGGSFAALQGGVGGGASGGDLNLTGSTGGQSSNQLGIGGQAPLIGTATATYSNASDNSGAGGGGTMTSNPGTGNGGSGLIIIEY